MQKLSTKADRDFNVRANTWKRPLLYGEDLLSDMIPYDTVWYVVALPSSFFSISFMNKIENHTRFLKVDAVKIKPLGSSEDARSSMSEEEEENELAQAEQDVKEIELTISTYTYYKGQEQNS